MEPELKYFFLPNIDAPEVIAGHNQYVRQQLADFVVIRGESYRDMVEAVPGYTLAAQATMELEGKLFPYYLYHRG